MDHRCLAMLMWALAKLQLQPSEPFLQDVMAYTLQLMPSMSLLSVVTLLGTFRDLQYLPPLPWMVEVCSAARAKLGSSTASLGSTGSTGGTGGMAPKKWQQRDCVRRFEESVAWYNQAVQAEAAARGLSSSSSSSSPVASLDGVDEMPVVSQQELQRRMARRALLAATGPGSEGLLAAAVGVAAAVAQQWHP
jgi:hypothetical protein